MIKLIRGGVYYIEGKLVKESVAFIVEKKKRAAIEGTLAYGVIKAHNKGGEENLRLKFDSLVSNDLTYVGIIQSAKAAGMQEFSVPYTLTNCHNANENERIFGLTAAKKYGGNFVPSNLAVTNEYVRETQTSCGGMILSSDSNTGYGALGTMAIAECGGELIKQLLNKTYDISRPPVFAVYLKGKPKKGVGPYDVALALIGATFKKGFLKDKILEFIGPGIKNISVDFRCGIDEIVSKTGCFTSIWETDEAVEEFYKLHGRANDFKLMRPSDPAYYDGAAVVDLSRIEPMIAYKSNVFTIKEFIENASEILGQTQELGLKIKDGKVYASQGVIACGSYENLAEACEILKGGKMGSEHSLNVYPQSQPVLKGLADNGYLSSLLGAGAIVNSAYYENDVLSFCMDARSVAATAANGGILTPATQVEYVKKIKKYCFDSSVYENKVYHGTLKPQKDTELICNNIADIPEQIALADNILLKACTQAEDVLKAEICVPFDIGIQLKADTIFASFIAAKNICDGFASDCQRTLGVLANVAEEYTSRRYRSSLIYCGIIPFVCRKFDFQTGDYLYIENVTNLIKSGCSAIPAKHISGKKVKNIMLELMSLTEEEKQIILSGSLINYVKK